MNPNYELDLGGAIARLDRVESSRGRALDLDDRQGIEDFTFSSLASQRDVLPLIKAVQWLRSELATRGQS